jgi:hypothetical protein
MSTHNSHRRHLFGSAASSCAVNEEEEALRSDAGGPRMRALLCPFFPHSSTQTLSGFFLPVEKNIGTHIEMRNFGNIRNFGSNLNKLKNLKIF